MQLIKRLLLVAVAGSVAGSAVNAAELRLRADAHSQGSVVRLGDVADIFAAGEHEVQSLADIELAPAPPPGKQRQMSVREIQDTLERRGLNLLQCHFSGASEVIVIGAVEPTKQAAKAPKSLPLSSVQEAQRSVAEATVSYLHQVTSSDVPWNVQVELTAAQAQLVLADVHHVEVRGGQSPWLGHQAFDVDVRGDKGPSVFTVTAEITMPAAVVVTTKEVPCGAVIQASDVTLQRSKPGAEADGAFSSLDDVVGQEAILAIAPGQVLDPEYVHTPVLVKRGSIITVYAVAPGVKIRTTGRCREDGSRGQCVTVEALLDRKTFLARVTGIDQVEVNAEAATTPEAVAASEPGSGSTARKAAAKARLATAHAARAATATNDTTEDLENR